MDGLAVRHLLVPVGLLAGGVSGRIAGDGLRADFLRGTGAEACGAGMEPLSHEEQLEVRTLRVGTLDCRNALEAGVVRHLVAHVGEIVLAVRRDLDVAAGNETRPDERAEAIVEDAVTSVAALWPGVGEEEIEAGNAVRRKQVLQDVCRLKTHHEDVRESGPPGFLGDFLDARLETLDADELDIRMRRRAGEDESPHAGADVDFDAAVRAEHGVDVEPLRYVARENQLSVCKIAHLLK